MPVHHPTGLTVEIVGIEASNNGRSCDQHAVCGSVLDDDVVVRLGKVQILNSNGHEETAIAAYLVSDGIDQCRVGYLQRHFVAHAKSFDGVLAQVTEVYSITSDSSIKRKKCRHNLGCCLAAVISLMSALASANVNRIVVQSEVLETEEEEQVIEVGESAAGNHDTDNSRDNDEDHSTFEAPSSLPAALMLTPAPTRSPAQCTRAKTSTKNVGLTTPPPPPPPATRNDDGYETPVSEKRTSSRKKTTTNVTKRKVDDNSDSQAPTSRPKSAMKKAKVVSKRKKKEELEIRYTTDGRKIYENFSDDSCDEDYHDKEQDDNDR